MAVGERDGFSKIRQFEAWARTNLPEELQRRANIGPIDLGEFQAVNGEPVKVVWGLSDYPQRFVYDPNQPRVPTWGRDRILAIVQNTGEEQLARPLVYERDLTELPPGIVGGLFFHLENIKEGRVTPNGRLNYWT